MGLQEIVRSKGYKSFMAKLYGWGAALVILGALFKINHYPFANEMLILGMGTEAIIFFFSAFEPIHEEVDWSLVYPELAGMEHETDVDHHRKRDEGLSEKLDNLLKTAQIDAELIGSLSIGLNKLDATAKSLNASTDIISVNTNYADELVKLTASLGNLNTLYMQQLEASSHQMEATAKAQENMNRIAETLAGTLESSAKYKEEINELSMSVNALNKIYGGMLKAIKSVGDKG
ncbi:MAG: gliding motility protein GldL [Bacteroidales bacterium]|nr:gliding motility protein GldL [Bacteroidales bacterium]